MRGNKTIETPQPVSEVLVDLLLTRGGRRSLRYAAWFAGHLRTRLTIRIGKGEDYRLSLAAVREILERPDLAVDGAPDLAIRILTADFVPAHVPSDTGLVYVTSARTFKDGRALAPRGAHLLFSFEECGPRPTKEDALAIVLPFGNRFSSLEAAAFAVPLAGAAGAAIVACHASYRMDGVAGDRAVEHLTAESRTVHAEIVRLAAERGVALETEVTVSDPTIHGYAIRVANAHGAFLTVVAVGKSLRRGNGELVVEASNGPVLVVAPSSARSGERVTPSDPPPANDNSSCPVTAPPLVHDGSIIARYHRFRHRADAAYIVEGISVAQYALKAAIKVGVGLAIASPMIAGDGFHNLADILQALLIMGSIWVVKRERAGYPFKLRELETFVTLALGCLVLYTGAGILGAALVGLLAQVPALDHLVRAHVGLPAFHPVQIDRRFLAPLISLMGLSVALSLATSWLQIDVGTYKHEAALADDGRETGADAKIETATLAGVVCVHGFGWRLAEYLFSLVVSGFVLHVGLEIFLPAWRSFLKKSLGEEVEARIRDRVLAIPGVESVSPIVTYPIGRSFGIASFRVGTYLTNIDCREALQTSIERLAEEELRGVDGIRDAEAKAALVAPADQPRRVAYACRHDGELDLWFVVEDPADATHLMVCDLIMGDTSVSRCNDYAIEGDLWAFAAAKQVTELYIYGAVPRPADETSLYAIATAYSARVETCLGVEFDRHT